MTSRYSRAYNFRMDPELAEGLKALKDPAQVRRLRGKDAEEQ